MVKGGPTFIFHPQKLPLVNATGCPGMAKAGSGDVLTGFIAALLAQGLTPYDAAQTGVYLHGLAGEDAEAEKTPISRISPRYYRSFSAVFHSTLSE